jgi:hypothetical protein
VAAGDGSAVGDGASGVGAGSTDDSGSAAGGALGEAGVVGSLDGAGALSLGAGALVGEGVGDGVAVTLEVGVGSGVDVSASAGPPSARRLTVSTPLTVAAHQRVTRFQGEGEEKSTTNNNPDTGEVGFAPRCAGLPPFNTNQAARLSTVNRGAGETYGACVAAVSSL